MKKFFIRYILVIFLSIIFLLSCSDTQDAEDKKNIIKDSVISTNVIIDRVPIVDIISNINIEKEIQSNSITNFITNYELSYKTNIINQLRDVVLVAPTKAFVDESVRVEVIIVYKTDNYNYDVQVKRDQIESTNSNTIYISLDSFDTNSISIEVRSISGNLSIQNTDKKETRITYLVKFQESGTRYLMVLISKNNINEPIIEQVIRVQVTFQTWLEKFWTWLSGAILILSGVITALVKIFQNVDKLKDEIKENKEEENNIDDNMLDEIKEEIKEELLEDLKNENHKKSNN